ncbi:NAC domain-containing protein 41-like [Argentina anserina]|uniref:NAC domain-containing protein 41-like n=1 Tax=Argentina anserina TaxID=57926 RepID=UPI0021763806|nr:NAC domain-containing protein 41-like [Potentilla anserina]
MNSFMETASSLRLPVGYRFVPTEQELLLSYLYNKVIGAPLPCNVVMECDLYGEEEAWKELFQQTDESSLYFFTELKKKNDNDSRIARMTSSGSATWKNQSEKPIHYDNHNNVADGVGGHDEGKNQKTVIGFKRTFSYTSKKEGSTSSSSSTNKAKGGGWVMHEFRLAEFLLSHNQGNNIYVLCRVIKTKKGEIME